MYVLIHLRRHVYISICMFVCLYVSMYVHMYDCDVYVCMYTRTVCMFVCFDVNLLFKRVRVVRHYASVHTHESFCVRTHNRILVPGLCTEQYKYICVWIYVSKHTRLCYSSCEGCHFRFEGMQFGLLACSKFGAQTPQTS